MKIRFKKLSPSAVVPTKVHASDARLDLVDVDELTESDRGEGGYGSTGK